MVDIFLKRIYEPADDSDGYRILIDRLWPRGIKKEDAKLTEWAKEVAPSNELRKWFCHKPELFEEFQTRYLIELRTDEIKSNKIVEFCRMAKVKQVTFIYAAKDPVYNHAHVLREEVLRRMADFE